MLTDSAGHGGLQIPHSVLYPPSAGFSPLLLLQIFKKTWTVTLFSPESYKVSATMDLRDYLSNNMNADPLIFIHLFNMYLFIA